MADAANFCRDLANEPSNYLTPTEMADRAKALAADTGLECEVYGPDWMREKGMGGVLGVAAGSAQEPRFIVLRYNGGGDAKPLALVGKGITFDTGGISIKPAAGMEEMKGDMSGGASVIAAMGAIARLRPSANVIGIVPATENMPGGSAIKPGDVLETMSGKTIEVINTDAEGRLVLSDGLAYAREQGATGIVDIATLTGAISIALGNVAMGAMTNNAPLLDRVKQAASARRREGLGAADVGRVQGPDQERSCRHEEHRRPWRRLDHRGDAAAGVRRMTRPGCTSTSRASTTTTATRASSSRAPAASRCARWSTWCCSRPRGLHRQSRPRSPDIGLKSKRDLTDVLVDINRGQWHDGTRTDVAIHPG